MKTFVVFLWLFIVGSTALAQTSTVNYIISTSYPNGQHNPAVPGLNASEGPNNQSLQSIGYFNGWAQNVQSLSLSQQAGFALLSRRYYDGRGRLIVSSKPIEISGGLNYQSLGMQGYLNSFSSGQDSTFERVEYYGETSDKIKQRMAFGSVYHQSARAIRQEYAFEPVRQTIRNRIIDEDGQITDAFTDNVGRTVMSTVKMNSESQDLVTLYKYDGIGNLIETVAPMGWANAMWTPYVTEIQIPYGQYSDDGGCESLPFAQEDTLAGQTLALEPDSNPSHPVLRYYLPPRHIGGTATLSHYVQSGTCDYDLNLQYRINKTGCWQSMGRGPVTLTLNPEDWVVELRREKLEALGSGCTPSTVYMKINGTARAIADKYVTFYRYDPMSHLIEKTSTDEGTAKYVYDSAGRLRFTQDQNQANRIDYRGATTSNYYWTFIKYDELGRVIRQGQFDAGTQDDSAAVLSDSVRYEAYSIRYDTTPFSDVQTVTIDKMATSQDMMFDLPPDILDGTASFSIHQQTANCALPAYSSSVEPDPCCDVSYSLKYRYSPNGNWIIVSGQNFTIQLQPGHTGIQVDVSSISQPPPSGYSKCQRTHLEATLSLTGHQRVATQIPSTRIHNGIYSYPRNNTTDLVWNYYDTYTFTGAPSNNLNLPGGVTSYPKGRLTKTIIRDPNTGTCTEELYAYDAYGRVTHKLIYIPELAQSKAFRYFYDASGRVLKIAYQDGQPDAFYQWYGYDNLSRLFQTYSSRTNDKSTAVKEAEYTYDNDHGGKLKQTKLGSDIQTIDYAYTVRDWLKSINDMTGMGGGVLTLQNQTINGTYTSGGDSALIQDVTIAAGSNVTIEVKNGMLIKAGFQSNGATVSLKPGVATAGGGGGGSGTSNDRFAMVLSYDDAEAGSATAARYNGNIRAQKWLIAGQVVQGYDYEYDKANRLVHANFQDQNKYSEKSIGYDPNGNIQTLTRHLNSATGTTHGYTYDQNKPNRLLSVSGLTGQMTYDGNGNLLSDGTKTFTYDYRNMPISIAVSPTNLYMAYDVGGQRTKYLKGSGTSPQDGSKIFVRGSNGNVVAEYKKFGSSWVVDHFNIYGNDLVGKLQASNNQRYYYLADHLGSIRVTLDESGNVDSWTDYYPFGKESRGSSTANRPKEQFTGKERDSEIGLDYFGARYYNAEIGRWLTVDPKGGKYPDLTPYNYVANNPIKLVDLDGRDIYVSEALAKTDAWKNWVASDEGKAFYAAFDKGGEWADVDVYFESGRMFGGAGPEIESRWGNMSFPNTQSGHTELSEDGQTVESIDEGFAPIENAFVAKEGAKHSFNVSVNPFGNHFDKNGYSTITHETDHVIYMTSQIKNDKPVGNARYQHTVKGMQGKAGTQYKLLPKKASKDKKNSGQSHSNQKKDKREDEEDDD